MLKLLTRAVTVASTLRRRGESAWTLVKCCLVYRARRTVNGTDTFLSSAKRRIAVIGAGSGGVCISKYLLAAGHDVTAYEAGSYVAGLWKYENDNGRSQAYKHLCIITPREKTRYSDFDFEPGAPRWLTHEDMYNYFKSYADHFGVTEHIRFRSPVKRVEPDSSEGLDTPQWIVTLENGGQETYDAVVIATGHLNEPRHVEAFRNDFAGQYLHSNSYRVADPYVGKRVCVVGTGNSGVDIASDVCSVASRTVIVARSGVRIQPKVVFGIAYPGLAIGLRKPLIPAWFRNRLLSTLVYLAHGDQTRLGFRPPAGRQHPTSSESIVSHIEFGRVAVKPGITSIDGTRLTFEDGSQEEFDVLVAATGYQVHLPFLAPELVPIKGNRVDLYKAIFPVDLSGIYFMGMLNPLNPYSEIFEAQSKVIVQHLDGKFPLPSRNAMLADIHRIDQLRQKMFTDSPRHGLEEPDPLYPSHLDDLRREALIRAEHRGQLPPYLASPVVRSLYSRLVH